MQSNPHVEILSANARTVDFSILEEEIRSVSDFDPVIERLHRLRNRYLFHRDASLVRLATLSSIVGLTPVEIGSLIERATAIVNKYSLIYRASSISTQIVGAND